MNIAIIPARGGSKRIPRKNIKSFDGQPMIGHSINAAMKSGCFDRIIVSTDDEEISEIAKSLGAEVPFVRPPELSDDYTPTIPVVQHGIKKLDLPRSAHICCLYPTAPFATSDLIVEGLALLDSHSVDYVFVAAQHRAPIQRAFRITADAGVGMFQPENFDRRSQDLEKAYYDAGQFYWGRCASFEAGIPFFSSRSKALIQPAHLVQDIDTPDDWERAERLFKLWRQRGEDQ